MDDEKKKQDKAENRRTKARVSCRCDPRKQMSDTPHASMRKHNKSIPRSVGGAGILPMKRIICRRGLDGLKLDS